MSGDINNENFKTSEKFLGMSPSQGLVNFLRDKIDSEGSRFSDRMEMWVDRVNKKKKPGIFDRLEALAPTDTEIIEPWLLTVVGKTLMDYDRDLYRDGQKSKVNWGNESNQTKYYTLVNEMEKKWQNLNNLRRNVEVNLKYPQDSQLIRNDFEKKFIEIGDDLFDFVSNITDNFSKSKLARGMFLGSTIVSGILLNTACAMNVFTPTAEVITLPSNEGSLPIGLLSAGMIESLPNSEVKDSLQNELISAKRECAKIPGCLVNSVEIFRTVTEDDVVTISVAKIQNSGEQEKSQVIGLLKGRSGKVILINKELRITEQNVDGISMRYLGYVDDQGKSHYLFEDKYLNGKDHFYVYDSNGDSYRVITKSVEEDQFYINLWWKPIVLNTKKLPLIETEIGVTPVTEVTSTPAPTRNVSPQEKLLNDVDDYLTKNGFFDH